MKNSDKDGRGTSDAGASTQADCWDLTASSRESIALCIILQCSFMNPFLCLYNSTYTHLLFRTSLEEELLAQEHTLVLSLGGEFLAAVCGSGKEHTPIGRQ